MYCPKCGAENADGAKFCKKCGERFAANATADAQLGPTDSPQAGTPAPAIPATSSAVPYPQPAPDVSAPGAAAKPKRKVPVPVIIAIVAAAAVLLAVFLVIPNLKGSNGMLGKVTTGDTSALSSATEANVYDYPIYFSDQDAAQFAQNDLHSLSTDSNGMPVLSDDQVSTLDGQWAIMNLDPKNLYSSGQFTEQSTGFSTYITVTKKTDLTPKDLASYMKSAGLSCDHVVAASTNLHNLFPAQASYASIDWLVFKASDICIGTSEDYIAIAGSYSSSNYTAVAIIAATPDAIANASSNSAFASTYQEIASSLYVK